MRPRTAQRDQPDWSLSWRALAARVNVSVMREPLLVTDNEFQDVTGIDGAKVAARARRVSVSHGRRAECSDIQCD